MGFLDRILQNLVYALQPSPHPETLKACSDQWVGVHRQNRLPDIGPSSQVRISSEGVNQHPRRVKEQREQG